MRNLKRIGLIICYLFLAYNIIGFLIIPPVTRYILKKQLFSQLGRKAEVDIVMFNPYSLSMTIKGLAIKEKDEKSNFVAIGNIYLNVQISSAFKLAPVVKEVSVERPYIRAVRFKDETFSFSDIIERLNQTSSESDNSDDVKSEKSLNTFRFAINNINILDGSADIIDEFMDKKHELRDLNITIPLVSNLDDTNSNVDLQILARFNNSPVTIKAKSQPFTESMYSTVELYVNGINIPYYFDYIPLGFDLQVEKGQLDLSTNLLFALSQEKKPDVTISGDILLGNLSVIENKKNPLVNIASCELNIAPSKIMNGDIHLAKLGVKSPEMSMILGEDGKLNVSSLFLPSDNETSTNESEAGASESEQMAFNNLLVDDISIENNQIYLIDKYKTLDSKGGEKHNLLSLSTLKIADVLVNMGKREVSVGAIALQNGQSEIQRLSNGELSVQTLSELGAMGGQEQVEVKDEIPWNASVKKLSVNNFSLYGNNLTLDSDAKMILDNVNVKLEDFSTKQGKKGGIDFSCNLNKDAAIEAIGQCSINPIVADMQVKVSDINLAWAQPFVLNNSGLKLSNGLLSTTGDISASLDSDTSEVNANYKGNVSINDFECVEEEKSTGIVSWKSFSINGIDVALEPMSANIGDMTFEELYSQAVLNKDGSINFLNILDNLFKKFGISQVESSDETGKTQEVAETPDGSENLEEDASAMFPINIGKMELKNSRVNFLDHSIEPEYSADIDDINFVISNLSTDEEKMADIVFDAKFNGYSAINITGVTNPFREDMLVDVNVKLHNMDMSPLSPYTGKYIGYDIKKGALSVDLDYNIKGSLLDSLNDLLIDGFTFGKKVESEDAIKAPLKLAVSMLKDRKGKIKLNAPVKGSIDDPEFEIGKIVLKTIMNIIVKAATSPFSFIASVFGGDGGYNGDNINHIEFNPGSVALTDLANKKLETIEKALYERPGLEFGIIGFVDLEKDQRALIAKKLDEFIKINKSNASLVEKNRDKYIDIAQKLSASGSNINIDNIYKDPPLTEKDKAILEYIKISDDDLRTMANDRAKIVKNYLLRNGNIETERVQLKEAETLAPDKIDGLKTSRVVLDVGIE